MAVTKERICRELGFPESAFGVGHSRIALAREIGLFVCWQLMMGVTIATLSFLLFVHWPWIFQVGEIEFRVGIGTTLSAPLLLYLLFNYKLHPYIKLRSLLRYTFLILLSFMFASLYLWVFYIIPKAAVELYARPILESATAPQELTGSLQKIPEEWIMHKAHGFEFAIPFSKKEFQSHVVSRFPAGSRKPSDHKTEIMVTNRGSGTPRALIQLAAASSPPPLCAALAFGNHPGRQSKLRAEMSHRTTDECQREIYRATPDDLTIFGGARNFLRLEAILLKTTLLRANMTARYYTLDPNVQKYLFVGPDERAVQKAQIGLFHETRWYLWSYSDTNPTGTGRSTLLDFVRSIRPAP